MESNATWNFKHILDDRHVSRSCFPENKRTQNKLVLQCPELPNPRTLLCSLAQAEPFPGEGSSLQEEVFANALSSGGPLRVLSPGPSLANSSLPAAVSVWCLVGSARADTCAHFTACGICLPSAGYDGCVPRDNDYAMSIPTVSELSCY